MTPDPYFLGKTALPEYRDPLYIGRVPSDTLESDHFTWLQPASSQGIYAAPAIEPMWASNNGGYYARFK